MQTVIPNWTNSSAELVVIRAVKVVDGAGGTYYTPELQIVLDDQTDAVGKKSIGVILKLDRRYSKLHELIMRTSMWADVMFNRVNDTAVVVDEKGIVLKTVDIKNEFGVELAEQELYELKRENTHAIH